MEERAFGLGERLNLVFGVVVHIRDAGNEVVHCGTHFAVHVPGMGRLMVTDGDLLRAPDPCDARHDRRNETVVQFTQ